jgi:dTMP kinase
LNAALRSWLPGRLLVLEGLDGSGKSTQAARLAARLTEEGIDVVATREPSDGPVGRFLRSALAGDVTLDDGSRLTPATIAALFVADRADHRARVMEPAFARGAVVVCDRHVLSSLAYQGAECDPAWVEALNAVFPQPDATVFLEIPPSHALDRVQARADRPQLYDLPERQRAVAQRYHAALADLERSGGCVVRVDGSGAVDEVTDRIVAGLEGQTASA